MLSVFASDLLPIFLIAGAGYLLARLQATHVKSVVHVVFYSLLPCLAFKMLVTAPIDRGLAGRLIVLAVLILIGMGLVGLLVARLMGLDRAETTAFLLVVMFSNGGNYGLPVVLFAYGQEALPHATVFFLTGSVLMWSVGAFLAAAGQRSAWRALLSLTRVPSLYGVGAALIVLSTGVSVPVALMRPIGMLADAALPVMILILGMQFRSAAAPTRPFRVVCAVAVALVVAPGVAYLLARVLGVTGVPLQVAVILSSMPTAVSTTILALEFDAAPEFVTSAVFLSTILSPLTLTPLIALVR